MATGKMLPHLSMSKKGDGEGGEGQNRPERISDHSLTKNDLWRLQYLSTGEAKVASTLLNKLTEEDPERSLSRFGMIIDTDPRHMNGTSLQDATLPGMGGSAKAKAAGIKLLSASYLAPEQAFAEEQAMHDRILYEMRQNLGKLKEYGKQLGIAFDVSKKKSRGGRMQGEKWVDDEMEQWKTQATRLFKAPEENKPLPEDEHMAAKLQDYCFQLERMHNDMKFMRILRQKQCDALYNEVTVTDEMETREQRGDGKMATMMSAVAILREKIQDTDQKLGEAAVDRAELSALHDELYAEYKINQNKLDEIHKGLANFGHDSNSLRLQLKDKLHDIEKVLGQGKLLTMAEIKGEIKTKYQKELEGRQKLIAKQIKIKEMLSMHEKRVQELTKKLQSQYDPNKDSPRRNELKRKALAFEEVFSTMMQRIGESDITKIVDLFQKQTFTYNAWVETVRDQEVRVKALMDEKALLETQLRRVSRNRPQGTDNETRQYTISGRNMDMAKERYDTASQRLMQLEGLIAHVKESVRMAMVRNRDYIPDTVVPPLIFPDEGEGGLNEWLERFTQQVADIIPTAEQYKILVDYDRNIELPPDFNVDDSNPYGFSRPITARTDRTSASRGGGAGDAAEGGVPPPVGGAPLADSRSPTTRIPSAGGDGAQEKKEVAFAAQQPPVEKPFSGIYVSMPAKLKVAIRMAPDDEVLGDKDDDANVEATGGALNMRIAFPPGRSMQRNIGDKEREEDEQESRAEHLDETIVSRDEHKRRAMRLIKTKEREKAEQEAVLLGEVKPAKKKGKKGKH